MKFLSEFKSCYGGGLIVVAAAEDTPPQQQPPVLALNHAAGIKHAVPTASRTATTNRGRLKKLQSSSAGNWKPELSVIFENSVVVSDVSKQMSIRSDKKKSSVKPKSRVRSSSYDGDEYGKTIHPIVLPAFSPTPFLF